MKLKLETINGYNILIDENAQIKEGDIKICINDNLMSKYIILQVIV